MDIESEIHALKQRVGDLEGAINVLTGQMHNITPAMLTLREQSNSRFDSAERLLERVVKRLDTVSTQVWSIRDDLPGLLDEALLRNRKTPTD